MRSRNDPPPAAPSAQEESCRHCCIKINGLTVRMDKALVLEGVNLHVHCGEVIAVVGPNGAGKTTLLRAILGEVPYAGSMESRLGGADFRRPRIGYVPQKLQFASDSPINVADLVTSAISDRPVWMGISKKMKEKAGRILAVFSVEHLARKRIGELSGGELQRVLLAMAMTEEPELLLLDEPSTGVDMKGLALFYQTVRDLREEHDIAVIIVTHDLAGISSYVDRIVLLNRSVIAEGAPNEVLSDQVMLRTFGPSLWNVSSLPVVLPVKEKP
jgi:zinc transport system ATP-binding protein